MAVTINAAANLTNPKSDPLEWSACQDLGGIDPATGDIYHFRGSSATSPILLYTSWDGGITWNRFADATNPYSGGLYGLMSIDQDVTNGNVHMLFYDTLGITNAMGYGRVRFNRSNGHITGYTWNLTPVTLTNHTTANFDPRGQIKVFTNGGTEKVVYLIGRGTTSGTDLVYYAGISSNVTPLSSSDFTGIDTTGSDTLMINLSDATAVRSNHTAIAALAQNQTNEDLVLFCGHLFSGDTLNTPSGSLSDLWYKVLAKSGSGWTAPTATSAGTALCSTNGTSAPSLCAVRSHTNGGYAMYNDPANGIKFSYVTSTPSVTTISGSPLSTANRGGFGSFGVDSSGNIHCIYKTEGVSGASPVCGEADYHGSWTNSNDSATQDILGICGTCNWTTGSGVALVEGSSIAQTVTGVVKSASIFTGTGPFIMAQPLSQVQITNTQATFSVTATASLGSLSYQWAWDKGSGYVNVGTNAATFTTSSLQSYDAGNIKVTVTDTNGSTVSSIVSLSVYGRDNYYTKKTRRSSGLTWLLSPNEWW